MLGTAMCGCCVEKRCVECHSVGGCGDGGCSEERVYVNSTVGGVLVETV